MATVRVTYPKNNVDVLVGLIPDAPDQPVDPTTTERVGTTNIPFLIDAGVHCFCLGEQCSPLWVAKQVNDGPTVVIVFGTMP